MKKLLCGGWLAFTLTACSQTPALDLALPGVKNDQDVLISKAQALIEQGYEAEALVLLQVAERLSGATATSPTRALELQQDMERRADQSMAEGYRLAKAGARSKAETAFLKALAIEPQRQDAVLALRDLGAGRPVRVPSTVKIFGPPSLKPNKQDIILDYTDFRDVFGD